MWVRGYLAGKTLTRDEEAMLAGKQRSKPSFPEPFLDVITPFHGAIASPNDNALKRLGSGLRTRQVLGKNFTTEGVSMQFGTAYIPKQNLQKMDFALATRNSRINIVGQALGLRRPHRPPGVGAACTIAFA